MFIGIDLDNTLIDYDRLFGSLAVEQGLLDREDAASKLAVRDLLRSRPGGEEQWRALQRLAYGPRILEAEIASGACAFLERLAEAGGRAVIVSHKTRTPNYLPEPDFHEAALGFLEENRLLVPHTPIERAHFQATRPGKAGLVAELGCTHFIDDLVEVFAEPAFPRGVLRILYRSAPPGQAQPHNQRAPNQDKSPDQAVLHNQAAPQARPWDLAGDWAAIGAHLFGGPGEGA